MNPHLSPDEISNWFLGERDRQHAQHLRDCPACSAEVERMESALGEFRGAMAQWDVPPPPVSVERRHVPLGARWALVAATAVALAVVPVVRHRQQAAAAEAAQADAILLEQVDAEVSQPVPRPLAPLVQMVSWSSSNEGNGESQ